MIGGHQAKAMPTEILTDPRLARCAAQITAMIAGRIAQLAGVPQADTATA